MKHIRIAYKLLKKLKPLNELLFKIQYVPLRDVFKNVIIEEKRRQQFEIRIKKEMGFDK